jgi:TatD DNase family protein
MKPDFVDFHAHLDLYPDLETAIRTCEIAKTATLAVTTTPQAFARNKELAKGSAFVRVALGLHPQLVADRASEMALFEQLLPQTRYVGEVGLDASPRFYRSFEIQKEVFGKILDLCADAGDKVLSIHSVRCAKHVLDMVEARLPSERAKVVLHWFSGNASELRKAVDLGCYFSINERMFVSSKVDALLKAIPSDRLLTETDGPFVERDGLPIGPGDVAKVVGLLAARSARTYPETQRLLTKNLSRLVAQKLNE